MYIAKIRIQNYRCFRDLTIGFQPGVNVIIGENNAGKSSVLRALGLVFDHRGRQRLELHDFFMGSTDVSVPPSVAVSVTLRSSVQDSLDDRGLVQPWLIKVNAPWEAQLTYRFFLPEEQISEFQTEAGQAETDEDFWRVVDRYLPKYVSRIYGGEPSALNRADPDDLAKFDYQFLDAIRDVEAELFMGSNPLLKTMLQQVLDQDTGDPAERAGRQAQFSRLSSELVDQLLERVDSGTLFNLVEDTGASDGGRPILGGGLAETDLMAALRLLVEKNGFQLPAINNGLGYNNLIYISLKLASLDFATSKRQRGPNAVLFPMLLIEEPEAHLHPALQYKLLKYLKHRIQAAPAGTANPNSSRQVFITTHSTHITAATDLDSIICMNTADGPDVQVSYPGRVFPDDEEGRKSKKYVERYLDATKSNMLFAKAVVLVEGLAEQLLLPCLAEHLESSFERHHVALVSVGGSTFKHFLPLFGVGIPDEKAAFAFHRRVACVLDADPARRPKQDSARYKACWPYQLDTDPDNFDYAALSGVVQNLERMCNGHPNVLVRHGVKTLEYDLAELNVCSSLLSPFCCSCSEDVIRIHQGEILPCSVTEKLGAKLGKDRDPLKDIDAIGQPLARRRAEFATYYLLTVEDGKGEHAFDLERRLRGDLIDASDREADFQVPDYVKEAILWACGNGSEEGSSQ